MPPARKEKIGMKEIAEAAGVSVMTVSAALSGSGRVSENASVRSSHWRTGWGIGPMRRRGS